MIVLVAGDRGLLGSYLTNFLREKGEDVISYDKEVNAVNYHGYNKSLKEDGISNIDIIFNCVAYTDVPKAETERKKAYQINVNTVGVLAKIATERKSLMVHFSTDFVFDGESKIPYKESDTPNPVSIYGASKYMSEKSLIKKMRAAFNTKFVIFRLQWLYWNNPKTFFMKVLEKAKEGNPLSIVDDEFGSPSSVKFVTESVYNALFLKRPLSKPPEDFMGKIYHLTHEDYCSRYECAKYFLNKMGVGALIEPVHNIIDPKVKRPKFGVLNSNLFRDTFQLPLNSWKDDVDDFVDFLKGNHA